MRNTCYQCCGSRGGETCGGRWSSSCTRLYIVRARCHLHYNRHFVLLMIIKMVLDSVIVTTVITNTVPTIVTITSISYFTSTTITLLIVIIMRVTVVFNSSCGDGEGRWWWPRVKTLPEGVRSDDNVDKGSEYKLLNHCVVAFFLTFHPSDRLTSLKQKTVDHFQSVTKSMLQSKERAKVSKQHRCWWGRSSRYQQLWKKRRAAMDTERAPWTTIPLLVISTVL